MKRERPHRGTEEFSRHVARDGASDAAPDPARRGATHPARGGAPEIRDGASDAAPDPARRGATHPARGGAPEIRDGARDGAPDPARHRAPEARDGAAAATVGTLMGPDEAIHALAARQHGIVARRQLAAAGLGTPAIDNRVRNGRLEVVHRGVYRVRGPVRGRHEREMAAVLACGDDGLVSHRTAAGLWSLLPSRRAGAPTHVTATGPYRLGPRVIVHRVRAIPPAHRAVLDGVPLTTPARTLLDLAGTVAARELEQAVAAAIRHDVTSDDELLAMVTAHPRRRGVPVLRALLASATGPAFTRSEAEERFLALIRRARLPAPATNVVVEGMEVDFLWKRARLVAEVDGFTFHGSRAAFERDRRRDAALHGAGYLVLRFPWRDIRDHGEVVLKRVVQALTVSSGSVRPAPQEQGRS